MKQDLEEYLQDKDPDEVLNILGYDTDLCFESDSDLEEYIEINCDYLNIDLAPEYKYDVDRDVYERVVELLNKDKISYSDWDNFLKQYE